MSESKKKLPFKIIKSNVTGGYANTLHQEFTGGVDIVNYHKDTYGEFQDNPLQSPFTEQWVGGYQFRHINVNEGSDQANNRPEGWHTKFFKLIEDSTSTITESFSSFSNKELLLSHDVFEGDGTSEIRTRVADNPGKKYFVLTNQSGYGRLLRTKELTGKIVSITYTYLVFIYNGIQYDYNGGAYEFGGNGLGLEDPDPGEDLTLQYSYDGVTWYTKKTIFNGSTSATSPQYVENTETVDLSSEKPNFIRFKQNFASESPGDNYALTDINITVLQEGQPQKLEVYSHGYLNSPPAVWSRDGLAKRPVNIKNIQGANSPIGNYFKNYEIVQTSGRRITNNLIVDGYIAGGQLTTQFITGSHNYSLPVLDSVTGSKSVIVERFNAPGSKEESSRGALDREGEEMSSNASLPWRNYKIRKPFYSQLSQSTPQFGGSIHGVNRNTVIRAGNSLVDNGFLVRSLPGTDIQYSWITASAETTAAELGGYQSFSGSYNLEGSYNDIEFISGSNVLIGGQEEFVDNYGIYSFIKNKKFVDLDSKTLSFTDVGLSASFGEITNSPYTFTTWTSIRTGESLVARQLRKNNIVSYQDPNDEFVSRNYFDPVVTFKYRPLVTKVILQGAPEDYKHSVKHTYTNNQSTFANKDLITNFEMSEDRKDVYDLLFDLYTNLDIPNNPISDYVGYSYKEIIWPREEFTGLDETRKRKAYYLDRAGYDRNGFDIQLGTQRAFWRDSQQNRKRSLNSLGGYSSSFGHISTEESGSSFSVTGSTILLDESSYIFTSSFSQSANMDSGIFNSISLMEYTPSETLLYTSSFEVLSASIDPLIYADEQINISYKRGYRFDISGEFNHSFVDFYGLSKISGSSILRDLGSVYRNSFYKSQLTTKQYDFDSIRDQNDTISLIKTEDDEIKINPKLRYAAFVGGGEFNNSSYIQENFRDTVDGFISRYELLDSLTGSYTSSDGIFGSDAFVTSAGFYIISSLGENSGSFTGPIVGGLGSVYFFRSSSLGIIQENKIYPSTSDLTSSVDGLFGYSLSANNSGNKIIIGMPATKNGASSYGGRVYIYQSSSSGINLVQTILPDTWMTGEKGLGTQVSMAEAGNFLITKTSVEGGLFGPEGTNESVHLFISGSTGFYHSNSITSSTGYINYSFSNNKIIVSDYPVNEIKIYNIKVTPSVSITQEIINTSSLSIDPTETFGYSVSISSGLYSPRYVCISSPFKDYNSISNSGVVYVFESGSTEWAPIAELTPNDANINDLFGNQVKIHISGKKIAISNAKKEIYIFESGSNGWGQKQKIKGSKSAFVSDLSNFVLLTTEPTYDFNNGIVYLNQENYDQQQYIRNDLFDQTFTVDDILFSTLDNGLQRTTEIDSGKKPFFDSYDDYLSDIRGLSKDLSIIPEFKISDHIRFYADAGNFLALNRSVFSIDGVSGSYKSALTETSSPDSSFYKTYLTSDLLKKHDEIRQENNEISQIDEISIKLSGIKKLLPYNGFYPQDRITQIANLYDEYVDNNLAGGVLNVSYENADLNEKLISNHPENDQSLGNVNASSIAEFDGKYYIAIGYHYHNSNTGLVKVFSSSVGQFLDSDNWVQSSVVTYTGATTGVDFGNSVKLVSGSNGLNLFVSEYGTLKEGAVYQMTSSDGVSWGQKTKISSSATVFLSSSANSYFGNQIDALYDNVENKFILAVGAYNDSYFGSSAGAVWIVTSSNSHEWTQKKQFYNSPLTSNTKFGSSLSLVSSSLGYHLYVSSPHLANGSNPEVGIIMLVTSSDAGNTWAPHQTTPSIQIGSQTYSGLGYGGLQAVIYGDRTYVFYSEPKADSNSLTDNGAAFVVYSAANHDWSSATNIKLASGLYTNDQLTRYKANYNTISAVSSSDGLLYYSFSALNADSEIGSNVGRIYLGKSNDGVNFEQNSNIKQVTGDVVSSYIGGSVSMIMSGTTAVSIYTDKQAINGLTAGRQLSVNLLVSGSEVEKTWKHAAIEPVLGPGIIFNTIKSGISVDWPCATGSVAVQQLNNGVVINPFYPQPKVMASFQGENGFYNLQGSIKSKINYRVPFEYILSPKDIFIQKREKTENITETYNVGSTIPLDSPISQFINGTYIYGGYEPYINPSDVGDIYGQTAKRFSVPFVYQKQNTLDNGLFTRAMNNFMAESVRFFLEEQKLTTFTSKPSGEWGMFEANKTYYMDVKLGKSSNLVMMEAWNSDKHPAGTNGQKMDGRYFGYPVNKTTKDILTGDEFTEQERRLMFNDPAYAPYTPPYFEGSAIARLSVTTTVDEFLTPEELFNRLTVTDIFTDAAQGWQAGSDAETHKMPIGSSIDLFGTAKSTQVTVTRTNIDGKPVQITDTESEQAGKFWIISPRFETPVLDFSTQQLVPYSNDYLKTSGFGRGMWSGYGQLPSSNEGIYMNLSYPFANETNSPYQYGRNLNKYDLLQKVGFKKETKKIGKIAQEKIISEAVILLPYYEKSLNIGNKKITKYSRLLKKHLFKVDKQIYNLQKDNIDNGRPAVISGQLSSIIDIDTTSISEMFTRAKKYVLPPELDFINNENIDPFVMYIFEVNHKLTQQDLIDIWQGLMPEISRTAELTGENVDLPDIDVISHKSGIQELFHGIPLPNDIKWIVFKIKQRAEVDYGKVTSTSKDDEDFRTSLRIGQEEIPYSYNWPYDFFSLIELAKIEMEIKYKKRTPRPTGFGGGT